MKSVILFILIFLISYGVQILVKNIFIEIEPSAAQYMSGVAYGASFGYLLAMFKNIKSLI